MRFGLQLHPDVTTGYLAAISTADKPVVPFVVSISLAPIAPNLIVSLTGRAS